MARELPSLTREQLLELDLDLRLRMCWDAVSSLGDPDEIPHLAALLRWAYGQGYWDCLTEPRRGALYRAHGFAVPARRKG